MFDQLRMAASLRRIARALEKANEIWLGELEGQKRKPHSRATKWEEMSVDEVNKQWETEHPSDD